MRRVAVCVSGRGSNLQALIDAEAAGTLLPARLALVLADRSRCLALDRATAAGLPTAVVRVRDFDTREEWDAAVLAALRAAEVELVVTAGFNRVLGPSVLAAFPGAILNTHPALLPAFPGGLHAVEDALAHGVRITGCTVHLVTEEVDAGPIVAQRAVEVREDDDADSLGARIRAEEHRLLPEALRLLAAGRLRLEGRRVRALAPV